MTDVTTASDEAVVAAIRAHHSQLAAALDERVDAVAAVARAGGDTADARDVLVAWLRTELMPHAHAEEQTLYPAGLGIAPARMLVEAMIAEHHVLAGLVDQLAAADTVGAVGLATAIDVLFNTHLTKENDQLLPVLAADPGVSLTHLLEGMHEHLGGHTH